MEESDSTGTIERQGYPTMAHITARTHTHITGHAVQHCKARSDSDDVSHVKADGLYVCGHKVRVCCVL